VEQLGAQGRYEASMSMRPSGFQRNQRRPKREVESAIGCWLVGNCKGSVTAYEASVTSFRTIGPARFASCFFKLAPCGHIAGLCQGAPLLRRGGPLHFSAMVVAIA